MGTIFSVSVLLVAFMTVMYFLGGNKSPAAFFEWIGNHINRLVRKRPKKDSTPHPKPVHAEDDKPELILTGGSMSTTGVKLDLTVFDRDGALIGSKRLMVSAERPVLIGRGEDDRDGGLKICLPDTSGRPTTSHRHCTLSLVEGVPTLKDWYTPEESVCNGKQKHSMSFVDGEYVGGGLSLKHPIRVSIGDYSLLFEPITNRSVPTFGVGEPRFKTVATFGCNSNEPPTRPAVKFASTNPGITDAPTKPFHFFRK